MRNLIDCIGILKIILLENISKSPPFTKGDLGGFRKLSLQSEMRIPHNPSLKKRGNKKQVRHLLWIFIIMIFILVGTPMKGIAFEDAIIAVVNDELITLKDLRDYVHSTYVSLLTQGMNDAQLNEIMKDLKENGINKLIEDRLIMSRANEIGILVRDKLVDDKVEQIKGKYKSEQVFLDGLINNGATVTDLRNKILEQLKIQFVIDHEVRTKVHVNPKEVTKYYEANMDSFNKGERVNLESIYVAYAEDKTKAIQRSQEIIKKLEEGQDFKQTSLQSSDTPSIGLVERGQLLPVIEDAVFGLAVGEISAPVEVDTGFYIFKLIDKIPPQKSELVEVNDDIYQFLYKKKFSQIFVNWLEKLKQDAYVEIKE